VAVWKCGGTTFWQQESGVNEKFQNRYSRLN